MNGLTAGFTQETGNKIVCTVKGSTLGQMVVLMRANIPWTRRMARGFTFGPTVADTKALGS